MKRVGTAILIALFALTTSTASAHSGRTDKNGRHTDKRTGTRHFHRPPSQYLSLSSTVRGGKVPNCLTNSTRLRGGAEKCRNTA